LELDRDPLSHCAAADRSGAQALTDDGLRKDPGIACEQCIEQLVGQHRGLHDEAGRSDRGSGRYNVAMGAATMIQGIGAALSTTLAGAIIVAGGYHTATLTLTGIAVLALTLLVVTVPETAQRPSEPLEGAPSGEPARHLL
jgi:hypothetical protein